MTLSELPDPSHDDIHCVSENVPLSDCPLSSPNINRFSFFHWHILYTICNNKVTRHPTKFLMCRYTTLWNINFQWSNYCNVYRLCQWKNFENRIIFGEDNGQLVVTDMPEVCVKKLSYWTLTFPSVRARRAVLERARRCCLLHDHLGWSATAKWRASRVEFDISRQHRQFDVGLQRTEVQKIHTNSQFTAERYACWLSRLQCRNRGRLNGQSNIDCQP